MALLIFFDLLVKFDSDLDESISTYAGKTWLKGLFSPIDYILAIFASDKYIPFVLKGGHIILRFPMIQSVVLLKALKIL